MELGRPVACRPSRTSCTWDRSTTPRGRSRSAQCAGSTGRGRRRSGWAAIGLDAQGRKARRAPGRCSPGCGAEAAQEGKERRCTRPPSPPPRTPALRPRHPAPPTRDVGSHEAEQIALLQHDPALAPGLDDVSLAVQPARLLSAVPVLDRVGARQLEAEGAAQRVGRAGWLECIDRCRAPGRRGSAHGTRQVQGGSGWPGGGVRGGWARALPSSSGALTSREQLQAPQAPSPLPRPLTEGLAAFLRPPPATRPPRWLPASASPPWPLWSSSASLVGRGGGWAGARHWGPAPDKGWHGRPRHSHRCKVCGAPEAWPASRLAPAVGVGRIAPAPAYCMQLHVSVSSRLCIVWASPLSSSWRSSRSTGVWV
jgi:hypothetical protein